MSSMEEEIGGLEVKMADWEMEDLLQLVSLFPAVPESSIGP